MNFRDDGNIEFNCYQPTDKFPDLIICMEKLGFSFLFNKSNQRFELLRPSILGYISKDKDTSSYDIGKCEIF